MAIVSKNKSKLIIEIGKDINFSIALILRSKVRKYYFAVDFFMILNSLLIHYLHLQKKALFLLKISETK